MPIDTRLLQPNVDFRVPQVDTAGALTGIGQGIADAMKQKRVQDARSSAMKLMQGGDLQGSIAQLMGAGDIEGTKAIVGLYRAQHPVMDPYQAAEVAARGQTDRRESAKGYLDSLQPEYRTFLQTHPDQQPPEFKQAIGVLQGGFGSSPTAQPTAPQADPTSGEPSSPSRPMAGESYDEWKLRQKVQQKKEETQAVAEAKKPTYAQAVTKNESVKKTSQDALAVVDKLLGTPDIVGQTATGFLGKTAIGGSNQANVQAQIDSLKGQIGFSMYQSMRDASKTGSAGIQRLTNAELFMLTNLIRSLDYTKQGWGQLKENLGAIKQRLQGMGQSLDDQLKADYPDQGGDQGTGGIPVQKVQTTTIPAPVTTDEPQSTPPPPANINQRELQLTAQARAALAKGADPKEVAKILQQQIQQIRSGQ